jgi:hypothetical protein
MFIIMHVSSLPPPPWCSVPGTLWANGQKRRRRRRRREEDAK